MKNTFAQKPSITVSGPIDTLALIVGVIQPLVTIPQIYLVYSSGDASRVSLFMWSGYAIAGVVLLIYGIKHRLLPVICAQVLWVIVQVPMALSVFIFA